MHSNNSWARGFMALFAIVLAMGLALAACPAEAAPFLYVTNEADNTVSVIDTATNTVVGSPIPVGSVPDRGRRHPGWDKGLCHEFRLRQRFGDQNGHQHGGEDGSGGG